MPRGPLTQETKVARALAKVNAILAEAGEELIEIPEQDETTEDHMREAQSVLNYFEVRGDSFKQIECRQCGLVFAYSYHFDGVKYCSVPCIKRALNAIGLSYNPKRDVGTRWDRFVPAIVPPDALKILESRDGESLEDLKLEIDSV